MMEEKEPSPEHLNDSLLHTGIPLKKIITWKIQSVQCSLPNFLFSFHSEWIYFPKCVSFWIDTSFSDALETCVGNCWCFSVLIIAKVIFWSWKKCVAAAWRITCCFFFPSTRASHHVCIDNNDITVYCRWYLICCSWELCRLPPVTWSRYSTWKAFSENSPSGKKARYDYVEQQQSEAECSLGVQQGNEDTAVSVYILHKVGSLLLLDFEIHQHSIQHLSKISMKCKM